VIDYIIQGYFATLTLNHNVFQPDMAQTHLVNNHSRQCLLSPQNLYKLIQLSSPNRIQYVNSQIQPINSQFNLPAYLDNDRPLVLGPADGFSPAQMTFQDSVRYDFTPTGPSTLNEAHYSWDTLFTNQMGIGFQHIGPFRFKTLSAKHHTLHCLWTMSLDFDKGDHLTNPAPHFFHCLFLLRQYLLCNADSTLEHGDFTKRNYETDRVGETRTCRDWSASAKWVDDELIEWLRSMGIDSSESIGNLQMLGNHLSDDMWKSTHQHGEP